MKKLSWMMAVCILLGVLLTGCNDAVEIDDEVYALAIALDRGSSNNYLVTVLYPTYKGGAKGAPSGGGGDNKENGEVGSSLIQSIEAPSILEAINLFNTSTGRRISLMHCKMVVFSEELARMGVAKYIAPITRYRETRRIMRVVVSKTSAYELIENMKSLIGDSAPKGLELFFTQSDNTALFPDSTLHEFYKDLTVGYEQPFAIYAAINPIDGSGKPVDYGSLGVENPPEYVAGELKRKGGSKVELLGTAVFKGDKMTGVLNGNETRFFEMVTGEFHRAEITLNDPKREGYIMVFDTRQGRRPKIKLDFKDGKPAVHVGITIEADIGSIQSRIPYEDKNQIGEIEKYFKEYLQKGIASVIEKTQKECDSDVFGFGRKAAAHFMTVQEWEAYKWLDRYKDVPVDVNVELNIRRTGLIYMSTPIY